MRAHTCVAVRVWPYMRGRTCVAVNAKKKKKNFQTACQKQQPQRPFLRSRMPVRAWPYVRARTCVAVHAWPYVRGCTCKPKKKKLSNREPETTTQAVPSLSEMTTGLGHCVYL